VVAAVISVKETDFPKMNDFRFWRNTFMETHGISLFNTINNDLNDATSGRVLA
jgi:hypothetical protein